jgi:hypothetical protein
MAPVSPQAGHFLGLQRVSTGLPHFSQVKTAMNATSRRKRWMIDFHKSFNSLTILYY